MESYERIMCAVDFSPLSNAAAARAAMLARQYDAPLSFLHVIEYFPEDRSNEIIAPESIDPAEYRESDAYRRLAELTGHLGFAGADRAVRFSPHAAWHEIVHFADDNDIKLIVLGCHGHHGIATLLGSTTNGVINRAPCDVLAVRSEK